MSGPTAIVVGGGPAGLASAVELRAMEFRVILLEKDDHLKGKAALFCCKADEECRRCGVCHVDHRAEEAESDPGVTIHLNRSVTGLTDDGERFTVTAADPSGGVATFTAEYLVWAGGFDIFDASLKKPFGFGRYANVITGLELEEMLRKPGGIVQPGSGAPVRSMAFIQCVGSRDRKIGAAYCSQACCAFAMRLAGLVAFEHPDIEPTIFYMDIQAPTRTFQHFSENLRSRVRLVKGLPGEALETAAGGIELKYENGETDALVTESFDLLVLSVGFRPNPPPAAIREILGWSLNAHGFVESPEPGGRAAVVGTALGPMDIPTTISYARAVAGDMARRARFGRVTA